LRSAPLAALLALSACAAPDVTTQPIPSSQYDTQVLEGWTVRVNRILLRQQAELGAEALRVLGEKLHDIARVVPAGPLAQLRKVPLWLGVDDGPNDRAQYHPSREWLESHHFNPEKARSVEIGSASRFLKTSIEQPTMVLHELAHAYHDQVLTFQHAGIQGAYREAKKGGAYDSVLRISGMKERHYAMTDPQEYFAEGTEAYFGTNDFYPFVRAELRVHDPKLFHLLEELWQ
jgi:dipeptidyl-peptidase-4